MPDYSLPMTVHQCRGATTQDSKPRVCPCEGVCAPPVGRMASLCTSQKLKRGVGSFVCDCGRERFSSKKLKCQGRQKRREAGQVPPASRRIFWPWQHPILFRQNAQAKARQGVRKKSRIKTCRLEGDPPVHTVPQCGPERRKTGFLDRNSYIFKVFVQSANGVIFREVTPALTSEYQWRLRRQQIYRGQLWLQGTFVDCTGVYNEKA